MKNICFVMFTVIMIGCGGGGSEETSAPPEPIVNQPNEPSMNDLTVDSSFDFTTDIKVTIAVTPQLVEHRAYLNVCQSDAKVVSDETCYLRTPVSAVGLTREIVIPHKEQGLKAAIWYYDVDTEPMTFYWQYRTSNEEQVFEIGE